MVVKSNNNNSILNNDGIWISEINDNNFIRDKREELGLFCLKLPHLPKK